MAHSEIRAVIYARRSTEQQDQSIDGQVGDCQQRIESRGWQLTDTYTDTASAFKSVERPGFERLMADAEAGRFDVLVVWESSRLSRQGGRKSTLATIWELREYGVQVEDLSGQHTGDEDVDDLVQHVRDIQSRRESKDKSDRVRRGKRQGMLDGIYQGWNAPYGYRHAGERANGHRTVKVYEPDPDTARIVREVFDSYIGGASPQEIAEELTRRGIEPPGAAWGRAHRYKRRSDPVWHEGAIRSLIANPLVAGLQHYKGVRIKNCRCLDVMGRLDAIKAARGVTARLREGAAWEECDHPWVECSNIGPAIIDPQVWEQAQQVLAHRARPWARGRTGDKHYTTHDFLLAGLLWCGHCGERIGARHDKHGRIQQDTGRKKKVGIYLCRGRRLGGADYCPLPRIKAAELDEAVRHSFLEGFVDMQATMERSREVLREQCNDEAAVVRDELREVEEELAEARALQQKVQRDYAAGQLDSTPFNTIYKECVGRIEHAEGARERLTTRLDALSSRGTPTDALLDKANAIARMLRGEMEHGDKAQLNQQLAEVFTEFRVTGSSTDDGCRIVVDPHLRPHWQPDGDWHTLDFSEGEAAGVEVVDFVEPVLRKVDLWAASPTGSW